jgi:hypothetical protein
MNKYPNSGRLNYSKQKVNPNSADLYGEIVFDRQFLRNLLNETDADDIPIKLSGWQKEGNYGPWFSIKVNTWKPEGGAAPPPMKETPADDGDIPF